jgi:hypothetical protein
MTLEPLLLTYIIGSRSGLDLKGIHSLNTPHASSLAAQSVLLVQRRRVTFNLMVTLMVNVL